MSKFNQLVSDFRTKIAENNNNNKYDHLVSDFRTKIAQNTKKYDVLRDLDIFVLDNSIRESTVGQLRGHTIESKWQIYNEVKKVGFKNIIVASFSHMTRVDDVFIQQLCERGEDRDGLYAFSEITASTKNKIPDTETVPVGLEKMHDVGLYNIIFEVDLSDVVYDFNKFPMSSMLALMKKWINWCHNNLHPDAKVLVNFRDLPDAMPVHPERVFEMVDFLANLPDEIRPMGLMFEEARGYSLPEEVGTYTMFIRKLMNQNNWKGHLLVHVHEKFGNCDATALESLMRGSDGIWASVCVEGAAMGHAASSVTLMNLVRLGNKKVLKKFHCEYLRQAAINITRITTGEDPQIKQPIYGARALDFVLSMNEEDFDMAEFFGEKAPVRITTLASPEMIRQRLIDLYGDDPQFTLEQATKMKEVMLEDLRNERKEEYMSLVGLAMLFDRAGGSLTATIRDAIEKMELNGPHQENLISQIKEQWDEWDLKDEVQGDEMLEFDSFYNGFMAPYFACYRCSDTKRALQAIDMDSDGQVDWAEFLVYLKWAMHEYPEIKNKDELLDCAFRKGLIPAMRDEILAKK